MMPSQPKTAPANIMPAIRGPIIKPTPSKAGSVSIPIAAFLNLYISHSTDDGNALTASVKNLNAAPTPSPPNTSDAPLPPSSPATRTSAQAVPSGYGNVSCSFTISARLNGIIRTVPSTPPANAIMVIVKRLGFKYQINKAGNVKITPAASDSPVDVIVCTILFSKMDVRFIISHNIAIDITAAGMDAETVIPKISPKQA